jgi:hypothetical protein
MAFAVQALGFIAGPMTLLKLTALSKQHHALKEYLLTFDIAGEATREGRGDHWSVKQVYSGKMCRHKICSLLSGIVQRIQQRSRPGLNEPYW